MAVPRRPVTSASVAPVVADDWRDMLDRRADAGRVARSLRSASRWFELEDPQPQRPKPPDLTGAGVDDLDAVDAWLTDLGAGARSWVWNIVLRNMMQ